MNKKGKMAKWVNLAKELNISIIKALSQFAIVLVLLLITMSPRLNGQAVIVFSENWDSTTSTQPWLPNRLFGWWHDDLVDLQPVSGRGNVLKINFPVGTVGSGNAFGSYRIPLDSAYKELYLSWDYYIPTDFDFGYADGNGGGKFFGGFTSGGEFTAGDLPMPQGRGWNTKINFGNGYFFSYNYIDGGDFAMADSTHGYPNGDFVANILKGAWHNLTIRLKINSDGKSDGLFEVFQDKVLTYSQKNIMITNNINDLIQYVYLNSFFGGTSPSPKDQFYEVDNLVCYYYPPNSSYYRSGASESGRTIFVPTATSYHPTPPDVFKEVTYTEANGDIESQCGYDYPVANTNGFQTAHINVSGATKLTLNVTKFDFDGGVGYEGFKQILNIYQGSGTSKTLVKTFENGIYTSVPTVINIAGNSATLEWQSGAGWGRGFSINYTSDGVGSGSNFTCSNVIARQMGLSANTPPPTPNPLNAPSALQSDSVGSTFVQLDWTDNSSDETGFELYCSSAWGDTTFNLPANTSEYLLTGLNMITNYEFKIRAIRSNEYSDYSNIVSVSTLKIKPNAPSNLSANAVDPNSVSLQWTDNSGMESGYELCRYDSSGVPEITFKLEANSTNFTDSTLNANTSYQYKIRAYNEIGYSSYSNTINVTTSAPVTYVPTAPSNLLVQSSTSNSATLHWNDNDTNETGYQLYRYNSSGIIEANYLLNANINSYTDTSLVSGMEYKYNVRAVDSNRYSSFSNMVTVLTAEKPVAANNDTTNNSNSSDSVSSNNNVTQNSQPVIGAQTFNMYPNTSTSVIGRIKASDPDQDALKYSIVSGNDDNLFKLSETDGILELTDMKVFIEGVTQTYKISVKVVDNGSPELSSQAEITINLKTYDNTVYIDPSNAFDQHQDGSLEHPYASWNDLTWQEGYYYRQKRGTTANEDEILVTANNVYIGAYGLGDDPEIVSNTKNYILKFYNKNHITIENLNISGDKAIAAIYFAGENAGNSSITNCNISGSDYCVRIIDGGNYKLGYNRLKSKVEALFVMSASVEAFYNIFSDNYKAISMNDYSSNVKAFNNVFYNNDYAISSSYGELELYNNIFDLKKPGSVAISQDKDQLISNNNIFYPTKTDFIEIGNNRYNTLSEYVNSTGLDTKSMDKDPMFEGENSEDFKVKPGSPSIDAGFDLGLTQDIYGNKVPYGKGPDIGVEEEMEPNNYTPIQNIISTGNNKQNYVSPNPSKGIFKINLPQNPISNIQILDNLGKVVWESYNVNSDIIDVNLGSVPPGYYYLKIVTDDKQVAEKIIVK